MQKKKLKKRIQIENATAFKLEFFDGGSELKSKEFNLQQAIRYFTTPVFLIVENSLNVSYFIIDRKQGF